MPSKNTPADIYSIISLLHKKMRRSFTSNQNLSISEIETLKFIYNEKAFTPMKLSVIIGVKKQTMSQILNKLEELNYVKTINQKDDLRKRFVLLTPRGKKIAEKNKNIWFENALANTCNEQEKKLFLKVLPVLEKISLQ